MDYLNSILGRKRADLKKLLPLEGKLRASAIQRNDYAGFRTAVDLGETRLSVVPEISRVHPALRLQEGVQDIRHMYGMFLQGGAQGISIAVEPEVYGGSWDMVSTVSRISSIPVMARDMFIHPAMICQAIVSGAEAVNLVAAALPAKDLSELYRMASGLGLDVMMEVHTLKELETVMDLEAEFICINNADPHTLQANPAVTEKPVRRGHPHRGRRAPHAGRRSQWRSSPRRTCPHGYSPGFHGGHSGSPGGLIFPLLYYNRKDICIRTHGEMQDWRNCSATAGRTP